jgi:hypothetical protein
MAYYKELPEDVKQDIWNILTEKVKNDAEHKENAQNANMNIEDYTHETVDNWVNCHNFDLSNRDWLKQTNEADI